MNLHRETLLIIAAVVGVVALLLGLHQLGEAKDRWVGKLASYGWVKRRIAWGRGSRARTMTTVAVVALIGAVAGASAFVGVFFLVRAQVAETEQASQQSAAATPSDVPNLVLHTYEAGAFAWHNDSTSGGIVVVASIGNSGSPSNARKFSVSVELADCVTLPGQITALLDDYLWIKDARFMFDLTLRQEDALSEKAFKGPIAQGAEVTGFLLVKFPGVAPSRLSSLKTIDIRFDDVRGRTYPHTINPRLGRKSGHYYAGTRLHEHPIDGDGKSKVTKPNVFGSP